MLFGTLFVLEIRLLFVFNEFVSFSGIPKGASTVTKGFTYSLEYERVKFVYLKLKKPLSILSGTQQHRTLRRCIASIIFLQYTFLVHSGIAPYVFASPLSTFGYAIAKISTLLRRHSLLLRKALHRGEATNILRPINTRDSSISCAEIIPKRRN